LLHKNSLNFCNSVQFSLLQNGNYGYSGSVNLIIHLHWVLVLKII